MCNSSGIDAGIYAHTWFTEDETANNGQGVLTKAGVENIASHKYKPGHYTHLDRFLNPYWTKLTELLPMNMAPNVVTSIGGLHCALAYFVLWYQSPNMDRDPGDLAIALSGLCTMAYYTYDCMDGKQARRTGNSSPLGQLFDHGVDCVCMLAHIAGVSGYIMVGGTYWYFALQSTLQVSFFMAQWEEYYTETLPHAMGNYIGVTEVNYSLGLIAIFNSLLDREKIWHAKLEDVIPFDASILENYSIVSKSGILQYELRHVSLIVAHVLLGILIVGSLVRVLTHENVRTNSIHLSALSKLITPVLVGVAPFMLPEKVLFNDTRSVSVASGILLSLLTMKIIVFSMAKMKYASLQMEAVPYLLVFLWISLDSNFGDLGISVLLGSLCLWYLYRLMAFVSSAIDEICSKLQIKCFQIKKMK